MKITIRNELIPLNLLVLVLIAAILLFPLKGLLIALGLPFLLFFPGYALLAALFPYKEGVDATGRIALSFGLSIVTMPLMGIILNYTWWGITLEAMLYSVSSFILAMSVVAWGRRRRLSAQERFSIEFQLRLLGGGGSPWDKALSTALAVVILGVLGMLGYVITAPKTGEKFTEFYILGQTGKATDYRLYQRMGETGKVVVGIINRESQNVYYQIEIRSGGTLIDNLGPVMLKQEEQWEEEVNIIPVRVGESQEIEFLLFKEGAAQPYRSLHLWRDVKEKE